MGKPTADKPAELALVRRDLAGRNEWASFDQVDSGTVYMKDRVLPGDLSVRGELRPFEQSEPGVTYRLDLSSLPD
jgi:hypothetical protein